MTNPNKSESFAPTALAVLGAFLLIVLGSLTLIKYTNIGVEPPAPAAVKAPAAAPATAPETPAAPATPEAAPATPAPDAAAPAAPAPAAPTP